MEASYSIGGLAKAAEVPASTIRFYERRGLLEPERRTRSSYRVYGAESLRRLRFIRAAQGAGFTLEDIVHLLELRDGRADPCGEVRAVLENRLDRVTERFAELRRIQRVLQEAVAWCREPREAGRCEVLDELAERSADAALGGRKPGGGRRGKG
jgi:MerR family mercuric resistance operon transcriptional regulator